MINETELYAWTPIENIQWRCNGGINPLIQSLEAFKAISGHEPDEAIRRLKIEAEFRQRGFFDEKQATKAGELTPDQAWHFLETLPRYRKRKDILPGISTTAQLLTKHGNLDCRAGCRDVKDLLRCVDLVGSYNDHDAELARRTIERFNRMLYYNDNNPNNTNDLFHYQFGWEGSHVIYVELRHHGKSKVLRDDFRAWRDYKVIEFKADCMTAGELMKADESNIVDENDFAAQWRWWWD